MLKLNENEDSAGARHVQQWCHKTAVLFSMLVIC